MTLLMVWRNKPEDATAINIASDSLLSGGTVSWPYAAKIHRRHPTREYFAYCGGSFTALSAITSAIATISNTDHLSKVDTKDAATVDGRIKAIHLHMRDTFALIPKEWDRNATLLLSGFDERKEEFTAWAIEMSDAGVADPVRLDLGKQRVYCFGSGAAKARARLAEIEKTGAVNSKAVVHTLIEVIDDQAVPSVGGAPQMVMLTKKADVPVGFWWRGDKAVRHLFGLPIHFSSKMEDVRWVTEDFEERPFVPFKRADA